MSGHDRNPPLTPATIKRAKADLKRYSLQNDPTRWADGHMLLSQQYILEVNGSPGLTRAADKGIEHIEQANQVITEGNCPPIFAAGQSGLARMYRKRVDGDRTENLTKALFHAKTALRICNNPQCPQSVVAELYETIGSIYEDEKFVSSDSMAANEDLAIRNYLASLQRSNMYDDGDEWVNTHMKVGLLYQTRKNGKKRSNSKVAIKHWLLALNVFTKGKYREHWANTHMLLAVTYTMLANTIVRGIKTREQILAEVGDLADKCIASCKAALEVYTKTNNPVNWGTMLDTMANAYRFRTTGERSDNIEQSLKHAATVLKALDTMPVGKGVMGRSWRVRAHRTLAAAYKERVVSSKADNIEHIIKHLTSALDNFSTSLPTSKIDGWSSAPMMADGEVWSQTQTELAVAFSERVQGDRSDNLKKSMECYAKSAEVLEWGGEGGGDDDYDKEKMEEELSKMLLNSDLDMTSKQADALSWAEERIKTADKFLNLVDEVERRDNMEKVIGHYAAAAKVLNKEEFPERWADVQMSMCAAYLQRVEGVRRENMENAMRCFNACKEVRAEEALPDDWLKQQWEKGAEARRREAADDAVASAK